MFSKAKRFEPLALAKNQSNVPKKYENEKRKGNNVPLSATKPKACFSTTASKASADMQSQCSSIPSVKSFVTPKPIKTSGSTRIHSCIKKPSCVKIKNETNVNDEIIKAQEVEIRNKDHTISEYNKQIEELRNQISSLQKITINTNSTNEDIIKQLSQITLSDSNSQMPNTQTQGVSHSTDPADTVSLLKTKISKLENQCEKLEQELCSKQVDFSDLEEVITIRDSLCKDLQDKLTQVETRLEETRQRLEMVQGHHALALDANESIRREYKIELETLKTKLEEEKQSIIVKSKVDQENVKAKYNKLIESIKNEIMKEKDEELNELQHQLDTKDQEMKAKLEQIDEATREKLKLCEIQFEERSRNMQEHCSQQQTQILYLEKEMKELQYALTVTEEQNNSLHREIKDQENEKKLLQIEKENLLKESHALKEDFKKKAIDFENAINRLTVDVDKAYKEKNKFEMSLSVTRDIVQVLTMRLRDSDNELEHLEGKIQTLTNAKEVLEKELTTFKNSLNNTTIECNEYKEALVNILKSKAALAKEHNRIMEHNVTLIESLQNVEKEAYRELGSIQNDLIEDVEMLKKESNTQIKMLRDEVEKKRVLCEMAKEHAGQATVAAEQSRMLLAQADAEISRLEAQNVAFQQQIQDQQSFVVEISLLRQENEELTMTVAKQSSIIDKMKKEMEQTQLKPKSPSVIRKSHKIGKENMPNVISPLRERNH